LKSQFFFEETIDDKEYQINIFGQHEWWNELSSIFSNSVDEKKCEPFVRRNEYFCSSVLLMETETIFGLWIWGSDCILCWRDLESLRIRSLSKWQG
jgi:hypothetical protein